MKTTIKIESFLPIFLFASVLICYANTIQNPFIYDDENLIVTNGRIVNLNLNTVKAAFSDKHIYNMAVGEVYRPLYILMLSAEYQIFGLNPAGYHVINILLHFLSVSLLYVLLKIVLDSTWPAFLAAIIFSVHPMNTESVAWIKGCDMIICNIFYISSLVFYINYSRCEEANKLSLCVSFTLFILALLSKEMAVTLPFVIISYELLINKNRKSLLKIVPFLLILFSYLYIRTTVLGQIGQYEGFFRGVKENIYTSLNIYFSYMKSILFPFNQNVDYISYSVSRSIFSHSVLLSIVTVAIMASSIYYFRERKPVVSFFIAWFLITLLPVSNVIPVKILFAERFVYLPSIGIIALFSCLLSNLIPGSKRDKRVKLTLFILVMSLSLLTILRNEVWSNPYALWTDALKKDGNNGRAHGNMALIELDKGNIKKAREHLLKSMDSFLVSSDSFISLGRKFNEAGDQGAAIIALKRASMDPSLKTAHRSLGMIYQSQGRIDEAIYEFKLEISTNAGDLISLVNLAGLSAVTNNCRDAETYFKMAFSLNSDEAKLKEVYDQVMSTKCNTH